MRYLLLGIAVSVFISLSALAQKMPSDADSDGKVSLQEYLDAAAKLAEKSGKPFDPAFSEKVFEKRDLNGDGFITIDEQAASQPKKSE